MIKGGLEYDAENFEKDQSAQIEGTITRKEAKKTTYKRSRKTQAIEGIAGAFFKIYWLLVSFAFGAILLIAAPKFTDEVQKRALEEPITMGATGLLVVFTVPLLLIALLISIIGIPLSLLGAMLFAVLIFIGSIYGQYTVGMWILIKKEKPDKWKALILGLIIGALLGFIPILGGMLKFLIFALGFGALTYTLKIRIRKENPKEEKTKS